MKRTFWPIFGILMLVAAPSVFACEDCPGGGGAHRGCVSGLPNGGFYCYGGFGEPCVHDSGCIEPLSAPSQRGDLLPRKPSGPLPDKAEPRSGQKPTGGFTLRRA